MIILGVALLAACTLIGVFLGDLLGVALGVKANVGGVGIAMMLLIAARVWLMRHDRLSQGVKLGVGFWAGLYIPIVVAMAAQQNVVAAVGGGPIVLIAATGSLVVCFACVALLSRFGRSEADAAWAAQSDSAIEGDAERKPEAPAPAQSDRAKPDPAPALPAARR